MKTKLQQVFEAVLKAVGSNMTRYQAAEAAEYLLKKHNGNFKAAADEASRPYKVGENFTY
jgi:hypothetical protein